MDGPVNQQQAAVCADGIWVRAIHSMFAGHLNKLFQHCTMTYTHVTCLSSAKISIQLRIFVCVFPVTVLALINTSLVHSGFTL